MKRFKWFKADWPHRIREVGVLLREAVFADETASGFVLDSVRDSVIEGRYIERNQIRDYTTDPFGKEFFFDRVEFEQWQFRLTEVQPGFELVGSTRGSRALANRLAEVCDFRLAIGEQSVDLFDWLDATVSYLASTGYVDIIQIGSIDLEGGVTGRATISGKNDVKDAVTKLAGSRSYSLLKLRYKMTGLDSGSITLSNTASAAIKVVRTERVEDCVRHALQDIWSAR